MPHFYTSFYACCYLRILLLQTRRKIKKLIFILIQNCFILIQACAPVVPIPGSDDPVFNIYLMPFDVILVFSANFLWMFDFSISVKLFSNTWNGFRLKKAIIRNYFFYQVTKWKINNAAKTYIDNYMDSNFRKKSSSFFRLSDRFHLYFKMLLHCGLHAKEWGCLHKLNR